MKSHVVAVLWILVLMQVAGAQHFALQQEKSLPFKPGENYTTKLYFYNLYWNKTLHIQISVSNIPYGWSVVIEPEPRNVTVTTAGKMISFQENLYVPPSAPVAKTTSRGEYITIKGINGSIPAKVAFITISVPSNESLGQVYTMSVNVTAIWFEEGQMKKREEVFEYIFRESVALNKTKLEADGESIVQDGLLAFMCISLILLFIAYRLRKRKK
jgi:hypothetical protein